MAKFVDPKKGVVLSQADLDATKQLLDLATRIENNGFIVSDPTPASCPLFWLAIEVTLAVAHYTYEGRLFELGALDREISDIKAQMNKLEGTTKLSTVQLLNKLRDQLHAGHQGKP